jgi:Fe-S cluster assembly protein SufD
VVVGSLAAALSDGSLPLDAVLAASGIDARTPFGALNTAFLADGALVYVPRGVALDVPIHVVFHSSGAHALTAGRLLVVLEEGATATLVETHTGPEGQRYWSNPVTELVVGANARLDAYRLQRESTAAYHTAAVHSRVDRDGVCSLITMSFGAALSRQDIVAVLAGPGAESTVNGLSLLGGRQHVDYHTVLDHAEPHCNSWEYFNGVFGDRARGVFTGRIIVRPGAQKTDAKQTNNNVLLSAQARADSQPQLEIYADDVKCTHGATLGPIDDAHLFYLQSRGLSDEDARKLLTYGFASEIIRGVTYERLAAWLDGFVQTRLAALTGGVTSEG